MVDLFWTWDLGSVAKRLDSSSMKLIYQPWRQIPWQLLDLLSATVFSELYGGTVGLQAVKRCAANFFLALPFDSCFCCPSVTGRQVLNCGRVEEMQQIFWTTGLCLLECGIGFWISKCLMCMCSLCLSMHELRLNHEHHHEHDIEMNKGSNHFQVDISNNIGV